MPFGARNATAHFQCVMDAETGKAGLSWQNNVASFVEDILIHRDNSESQLVHLIHKFRSRISS